MKTIGLIGGISWESSALYYRIINQQTQAMLGGSHFAQSLMYSFDFESIETLQRAGNWEELGKLMVAAAQRLERGGAGCIVICANTMHKMADAVEASVQLPLLHIADATAEAIQSQSVKKVGLLGTKYTMEEGFLRDRLLEKHKITTIVPNKTQRGTINRIIYEELVKGILLPSSRAIYLEIINDLMQKGAEGIVLGCTEIGLLVKNTDALGILLFDTAEIHAKKAVSWAIGI